MTRTFTTVDLDLTEVCDALDTARRAPSAGFSQGVHFLVLTGDERQRMLATSGADAWFAERTPGVLSAPVLVVPLADPTAYTARYGEPDKATQGLGQQGAWEVPYWLTDTAMATQNLLLLAEARGWGALLFGVHPGLRAALDELAVPTHVCPLGVVALGWRGAQDQPSGSSTRRARRPATEVVHVGRW